MTFRRFVLVALLATLGGIAGAGAGARASALAACGRATPLKGAPILEFGPVRIAGFSNVHCAWIRPGCRPSVGGYQSTLALELSEPPSSPIALRAGPSEAVKFILVGATTPAPKVPRCLSSADAHAQVSLKAPKSYYVLFVFVKRGVSFHLIASRGRRRLGAAVLTCRV